MSRTEAVEVLVAFTLGEITARQARVRLVQLARQQGGTLPAQVARLHEAQEHLRELAPALPQACTTLAREIERAAHDTELLAGILEDGDA